MRECLRGSASRFEDIRGLKDGRSDLYGTRCVSLGNAGGERKQSGVIGNLGSVAGLFLVLICASRLKVASCGREGAFIGYSEAIGAKRVCVLLPHLFTSLHFPFIGYSEAIGKKVILETPYGKIGILLHVKIAPETSSLVLQLAESSEGCPGCHFYRNEAPPKSGYGPPYGLLQGSLAGLTAIPPREGNIIAKRGHVCMIPNTREFFISLMEHDEWGTAHSVWGEVEDLTAADKIIAQAYTNFTHPDYGTLMRMMVEHVPFTLSVGTADRLPDSDKYFADERGEMR